MRSLAVFVVVVGGGASLWAIVAGLVGTTGDVRPDGSGSGSRIEWARTGVVAALAVVAGVVAWVLTGWPAAALLAAAGVAVGPMVSGDRRGRARHIARIEALAGFVGQIRDALGASGGVPGAIAAAATEAPPAISEEVARLALGCREDPVRALNVFAGDMADPVGDLVVTALTVALSGRAGELTVVLKTAETSARATASMRRQIEASRARVYTSIRITTGVTAALAAGLILFQRPYLAPFDSAGGQLMILVVGAMLISSFWLLSRMTRTPTPPRLLGAEVAP